jgi:pimeloyl-ACP methyl ester carboxylesterase
VSPAPTHCDVEEDDPCVLVLALLLLALAAPLRGQPAAAGRMIAVPGAALHVREQGRGAPLLLLHGFGGCAATWDPFVARLARRHRVIVVELRGHGRSTNPGRTFTMRQSAADVLAVLDSLGLPRVRAIGISAGAMTLLHVATRHPDRVEALVLVGGTTALGDQARAIVGAATREALPPEVVAEFAACATRGAAQVDELLAQFRALAGMRDDPNFSPADLARITRRRSSCTATATCSSPSRSRWACTATSRRPSSGSSRTATTCRSTARRRRSPTWPCASSSARRRAADAARDPGTHAAAR